MNTDTIVDMDVDVDSDIDIDMLGFCCVFLDSLFSFGSLTFSVYVYLLSTSLISKRQTS